MRGSRLIQLHFALLCSYQPIVDAKINQVAPAVRNVSAPIAHALGPPVVVEFIEFDVAAAESDAFPVDAREIGLAADARAEAGVERVVPDVQLPRRWRVNGRDEI